MKAQVVLNEQHKLLDEQVELLNEKFGREGWEIFSVPSTGWKLSDMNAVAAKLSSTTSVVFASPVPILIRNLSLQEGMGLWKGSILLFHNDIREKKELPNGKIILTVAQTGWQLV